MHNNDATQQRGRGGNSDRIFGRNFSNRLQKLQVQSGALREQCWPCEALQNSRSSHVKRLSGFYEGGRLSFGNTQPGFDRLSWRKHTHTHVTPSPQTQNRFSLPPSGGHQSYTALHVEDVHRLLNLIIVTHEHNYVERERERGREREREASVYINPNIIMMMNHWNNWNVNVNNEKKLHVLMIN